MTDERLEQIANEVSNKIFGLPEDSWDSFTEEDFQFFKEFLKAVEAEKAND